MKFLLMAILLAVTAAAQTVDPGRIQLNKTVVLTVLPADGTPPFTYRWYKDGAPMAGQISDKLTIPSFQTDNEGLYHAVVANEAGSVVSQKVTLTLIKPPTKAAVAVGGPIP